MSIRCCLLVLPLALVGCFGTSPESQVKVPPPTWVEKDIAHEDVVISLGSRERRPVAGISRGGKPAADAMVFCARVDGEGGEVVGNEAATVYETSPDGAAAYYVAEAIELPADGTAHIVRFRVVLPDVSAPWTRDVAFVKK